jgi:endonuclease/exonuclease/phosphatase family metal-dependent hydrolase
MNEQSRRLITAIHNNPHQVVLVTAGAGAQALADLLAVAGASRTLLEAMVPYSSAAFDDFLGYHPVKYVAPETAVSLSGCALSRARQLAPDAPVIGLACTATISTDYPKRGEHHAHTAVWQPEKLTVYDLHLEKGARSREEEERLISNLMLNALAQAAAVPEQLPLDITIKDTLTTTEIEFARYARQLTNQEIAYFGIAANGRILATPPAAILSGSFNPLHEGHTQLAQAAGQRLGMQVAFECTAVNADKPPLPPETLLNRMAQFAGRWPIFASTAPTFVEKARLYPGITFVVGFDTAVRILQPRFYGNSTPNMHSALAEIQSLGNTFLVAGRVGEDSLFHDLHDLAIPTPFNNLFHPLPFRLDISSTELRSQTKT